MHFRRRTASLRSRARRKTRLLSPPSCVRCGETVGVYEPVVRVGDSLVRGTSRVGGDRRSDL
jgi:hypothetical protein